MIQIIQGDCIEVMRTLPDESVQCCVTSPPYWGLRDYGVDGQIGLEKTPEEYVAKMVAVFREVRRVLKPDGTLWLNLGDSYAGSGRGYGDHGEPGKQETNAGSLAFANHKGPDAVNSGLKPKDLVGIPWRVAFALQADGWYLRQDIIWHKPNPMPESVRDRCTKSHEYIFLLTKRPKYYYDAEAIKEPAYGWNGSRFEDGKNLQVHPNVGKQRKPAGWDTGSGSHGSFHRDGRAKEIEYTETDSATRNKRSVWTVTTKPYSDAHFATFPPDLIEPCIMAGSRVGDTVLDPFGGAGTTALVCSYLSRGCISIELNPEYVQLSKKRVARRSDMFTVGVAQ